MYPENGNWVIQTTRTFFFLFFFAETQRFFEYWNFKIITYSQI